MRMFNVNPPWVIVCCVLVMCAWPRRRRQIASPSGRLTRLAADGGG
jgi:hypothetical protein